MKYKKILLGLGSLVTIVAPISAIIACGTDDKTISIDKKANQQIVDEVKGEFVNAPSSKDKVALVASIGSKVAKDAVTAIELGYIAPTLAEGVSVTYAIKTAYDEASTKVVIIATIIKGDAKTTQELEIIAMTDAAVASAAVQALTNANLNVNIDKQQLPSVFVTIEANKTNILIAIKDTITNNAEAKALIVVGDITLTDDDETGTITVTITNHGDNKELTMSGFISQADLDVSQLGLAVKNKLINILQVTNTRNAIDAQSQFPSAAFDVLANQTTFSVTATKGIVNNFDGSIAYTYSATHSKLAASPVRGSGIISGFQTNLTSSQKKARVQEELKQITSPIDSNSIDIAPEDYDVEAAKPHLDALVANKYGVDPTYTKGIIGDGQVTFMIVYTFGNGDTITKNVVINRLKSEATIKSEHDSSDINDVALKFANNYSVNVTSQSSIAAVSEGTLLDQTKAQALGIAWPNDIKGTTINYSHAAIISDGIIQVSIKIAKGSGQEITKQLAITITGIDAFKLTTAKVGAISQINDLEIPVQNDTNYDVKLFNKIDEIKQVAINAINLIKTLSQVASIAHDELAKVVAAINAYQNSIFLNAKNKTSQYGNKIISGQTLGDFGLTMDEVEKIPEPLLKVIGVNVKIAYKNYDFINESIIATLTISANNKTKSTDIVIKGFANPKTILNAPTQVGEEEFREFILPSNFKLPNGVTDIGARAFFEATLPLGFTISNSVTHIGDNAFKGAILPPNSQWFDKDGRQITKPIVGVGATIRLTNSIIPYGQYQDEVLPKDFQIPSSVTHIGKNAFERATLPEGFMLPNSLTHIGREAFKYANLPKRFKLPSGVTYIGIGAFIDVTLPKDFKLPSSVTHIDAWAFYETTLPIGFTLPNTVTHITTSSFIDTLPKGSQWFDRDGRQIAKPIVGVGATIKLKKLT